MATELAIGTIFEPRNLRSPGGPLKLLDVERQQRGRRVVRIAVLAGCDWRGNVISSVRQCMSVSLLRREYMPKR